MIRALKRVLSVLLSLILIIGIVPISALAETKQTELENDATVSVNTDNDFSKIVMKKVESEEDDTLYGVTDIKIGGKLAQVHFVAPDNCTLVVAIYSENGRMLGYGTKLVDSTFNDCIVSLSDIDFPEYFVVKGFVLDKKNAAVCKEYVSRENTLAYEQFLALTVNDFDQEYVMNFDEDATNNFAVLNKGTIMAETIGTTNILVSYDESTDTYVISNADSKVKGLKNGDTLYLKTGEGNEDYIIVTVKSISINNGTVTIVSDEETVEGVFECIKIDSTGGMSEENVKNAELGSALTLVEEDEQEIQTQSKSDVDVETEMSKSVGTKIDYTIGEEGGNKVSVKGGLTFSFNASARVFYDKKIFKEDYFEYKFSHEEKLEIDVTVTGTIAVDKDKVKIGIDDIIITGTPLSISVNVFPILEFNISATFSVSCTSKFTQTYNPYDGERREQEKDKEFDCDLDRKLEIKIGFGIEVEVKAVKILSVSISASVALDIAGEIDGTVKCLLDKYHYCDSCVEGQIDFVAGVELTISIKITKKLKWDLLKATIAEARVKLCDFYISRINGIPKIGFTTCPNKMHKVSFTVYWFDSNSFKSTPIEGATISLGGGKTDTDGNGILDGSIAVTDKDGKAAGYYKLGTYKAIINADNYKEKALHFNVDGSLSLSASMEKSSSQTNPGSDPDPNNPGGSGNTSQSFSGSTLTISGTGCMTDYTGFGQTPWSSYKDSIKHIVIESGVTGLGNYAFAQCENLETVTIADTVTDIGMATFYQCSSLQSINLPDSVKAIDDYAFYGCYSMNTLSLGSVESIGSYAFAQCTALENVVVPATTTNIGDSAFAWCQNLDTIEIKNKNCVVYDSSNTIYVDTTIIAPVGSKAQTYANKYGRAFSSLTTQSVIDTTKVYDSFLFTYSSCVAGSDYILLNVTGYGNGFELTTSNLEFIDQLTADSNGKITRNFIPRKLVFDSTTLLIGDFGNGTEAKIIKPTLVSTNVEINNNPGTLKINYQEGVKLTATVISPIDDCNIQWYVNDSFYCAGDTFECKHIKSDIKVTAKLVDINGNPIIKDGKEISAEETVKVNASFIQKIIAFFKFTLFRQVVIRTN